MPEQNAQKTYDHTTLWLELKTRATPNTEAERIAALAKPWLDEAQIILAKAGSQPPDFTLHDEEHAFRVAERMVKLLPSGLLKDLSHYELLILLLAAYLHDIGMAPQRLKVDAHYNYLLTGGAGLVTPDETHAVREWLDGEGYESIPPIPGDATDVDRLRLAQELTAYYCRHKHNDWSEEYIRVNLPEDSVYRDWRKHLAMVCTSHHHGYDELVLEKYAPVSKGGVAVHLRFMAVLLRLADILENDPERTPAVLLRHRGIASGSQVYWWKDHYFDLHFDNRCFSIHGRPPEAIIQKAIMDTSDAIEDELRLAERLDRETHFDRCNWGSRTLPHKWDITSHLARDVKPADDTYEYIDGAFRPNTRKLLELLSGSNLYDEPLDAVRELLQNAFDAVRESIAHQRVRLQNGSDSTLEQALAEFHEVVLRFEVSKSGARLICSDTGMGMTRKIIENYLLVSGTPYRREIIALERACRDKGFRLGRTGQFGIGVLSYFMLASKVSLRTERSDLAGDSEGHGWSFSTQGVGTFGELRRTGAGVQGTHVHLELRKGKDFMSDPAGWYQKLRDYLLETLVHVPCRFRLIPDTVVGGEPLDIPYGWVKTQENGLRQMLLYDIMPRARVDENIYAESRRRKLAETRRFAESLEQEVSACLRWVVRSGELGDGMIRYRIHLPYFELPGGASLAFMRVEERAGSLMVSSVDPGKLKYVHGPKFIRTTGWKGMQAQRQRASVTLQPGEDLAIVEVDWLSGEVGDLAVSRNALKLSKTGLALRGQVNNVVNGLLAEFQKVNAESMYATLNCSLAGFGTPSASKCYWLHTTGESMAEAVWRQVSFPFTSYFPRDGQAWYLHGQPVTVLEKIDGFDWHGPDIWPDRVIAIKGGGIAPYWTAPPVVPPPNAFDQTALFPPDWRHLSGFSFKGRSIWNREHPLVRLVEDVDWIWFDQLKPSPDRFLEFRNELLERRGRMATWLLRSGRHHFEFNSWLAEEHPNLIGEVMDRLAARTDFKIPRQICSAYAGYTFNHSQIDGVSRSGGWQSFTPQDKEWRELLPDLGPDWTLEVGQ